MAGEQVPAGFDAVIARDGGLTDHEARSRVADALLGKLAALEGAESYEQALTVIDDLVARLRVTRLQPSRNPSRSPAESATK
jgi:hypothetical protein